MASVALSVATATTATTTATTASALPCPPMGGRRRTAAVRPLGVAVGLRLRRRPLGRVALKARVNITYKGPGVTILWVYINYLAHTKLKTTANFKAPVPSSCEQLWKSARPSVPSRSGIKYPIWGNPSLRHVKLFTICDAADPSVQVIGPSNISATKKPKIKCHSQQRQTTHTWQLPFKLWV